jgi:hypothetical protein
MERDFQLQSSPSLSDLVNGEALVQSITKSANSRRVRRPVLVAWSFRVEKSLHSDLQRASKKLSQQGQPEVNMSDIVNGLLENFLPVILAQRATVGEQVLADPGRREELAQALDTVMSILRSGK